MDLLNSILNSMESPPSTNEQQKMLIKKQKDLADRIRTKQKEELLRFRKYVEDRIERFAKDDRLHLEFQPLDNVHRSVIHEVAEYGGFIAMSFGREGVDRYSVVYKKENAPTEDEISARRNGECWNEEVAKEYAERKKANLIQDQKQTSQPKTQSNNVTNDNDGKTQPTSNYKDKYAHLIGQSAALEAARKTETNKSYGFVPSKNKKDMRSIEQTLADIQAKKKLRLQQQQQEQQQQQQEPEPEQEQPNNKTNIAAAAPKIIEEANSSSKIFRGSVTTTT